MFVNADKTKTMIMTYKHLENKITPDSTIMSIHTDGIPVNEV